jgi:hypothetical protein
MYNENYSSIDREKQMRIGNVSNTYITQGKGREVAYALVTREVAQMSHLS